jgi:hypothetical protein
METSTAPRPATSSRASSLARVRRAASVLAAVAGLALPSAAAADDRGGEDGDERVQLQTSWRMAPPTLRLQPEGARLVLDLPAEWMPAPDLGRLGIPLDPNKHWRFRSAHQLTSASIGAGLRLSVEDRTRSVWFGISLLPRAAVAVLRFDPMPAQLR